MWLQNGMKISAVIAQLEKLKAKHGDVGVYKSGGDYPEPVSSLLFTKEGTPGYIPPDTVVVD